MKSQSLTFYKMVEKEILSEKKSTKLAFEKGIIYKKESRNTFLSMPKTYTL